MLQSQLKITARSLGNLFIPALNAVLPYAIAFVKVITWAANALGELFGFELTEIDYSSLQGASVGAEDLADNLGNAASAAKDLKDYTMGFDQLNVIQPQTASGGGGGSSIGWFVI